MSTKGFFDETTDQSQVKAEIVQKYFFTWAGIIRATHYPPSRRMDRMLEDRFRGDFEIGEWMDEKRRDAIELMNSILREIGHPELRALR